MILGTVFVASANPWKRFFLVTDEKQLYRVKVLKHPSQPGMRERSVCVYGYLPVLLESVFERLGLHSALGAFGMPSQTGMKQNHKKQKQKQKRSRRNSD